MQEEENINVETTENEGVKTYTQEEVAMLLQSEADKRVTQALEKQKKQYEKKLSLSALDEESRVKAEKDLRIQELEEQLKEFNVLQTKNEVVKVLGERGLNPAFADLIAISEDMQEAQEKIETLDKLFKSAVQEEVKKRLNTNVPSIGMDSNAITKEKFAKMNMAQRTELYKADPDLYRQLTNRG